MDHEVEKEKEEGYENNKKYVSMMKNMLQIEKRGKRKI